MNVVRNTVKDYVCPFIANLPHDIYSTM